jgi:hypothetical protein
LTERAKEGMNQDGLAKGALAYVGAGQLSLSAEQLSTQALS